MKPRVVHFGKLLNPDQGGVERVSFNLARQAAFHGWPVSMVGFSAETQGVWQEQGVTMTGVRLWRVLASQPLGWGYVLACWRAARQADLVHVHTPNMLAAWSAWCVSWHKPVVVHWHADVINKGWMGRFFRPLERALLRRACQIVVTSRVYALASPLVQQHAHKLHVVPIGTDDYSVPVQDPKRILSPELRQQLAGRRLVLSVGRLVHYKGYGVLVEAARALPPDVLVVVVGRGALHDRLVQAVRDAGVQDKVLFTGYLDDAAVQSLLQVADVYCMPSIDRAEAFGVVQLEAMSCGVPVVTTEIEGSGVPWVNAHGVSGLNVPVGDAPALAQALLQVLEDPDLHAILGQGARARYEALFTMEATWAQMQQVYDMVGPWLTLDAKVCKGSQ